MASRKVVVPIARYISDKLDLLEDFMVFECLSKEEIEELKNAKCEVEADRITRKFIEKYL